METIHVQLTIGRLILSEALTTILPSVLIVIVKKSQFVSGFISFYKCFSGFFQHQLLWEGPF